MRTSSLLLSSGLLVSVAVNAWLLWSSPPAPPALASTSSVGPLPAVAATLTSPSAPAGAPDLASFARVVEEAKREREIERAARAPSSKAPALVDARVIADAQCRHARGKAVEAFRHDAGGIRKFLIGPEPDAATLAEDLERTKSELADVIGTDPRDARVGELAQARETLELEARRALKAAVAVEPPDWRTGLDVVIDLYRKQDAAARRILGDEKAQEVMLADVDGRAGILAIGSSLVGEPWEASARALE